MALSRCSGIGIGRSLEWDSYTRLRRVCVPGAGCVLQISRSTATMRPDCRALAAAKGDGEGVGMGMGEGEGPASGSQFVKRLDDMYPKARCLKCRGLRQVACRACKGQGRLAKGGYHASNPVAIERIVGSKWTAMERTFGWRHFLVASKRRTEGQGWFLEMVATCDQNSRFWVNSRNLKDRERWSMGWLQKSEMTQPGPADDFALVCKACKGLRQVPCQACDLALDAGIIHV